MKNVYVRILLFVAIVAGGFFVFDAFFICKASPVSLTRSTLQIISNKVYTHLSDYGEILQAKDIFSDPFESRELDVDAWGNKIEYLIIDKHKIRIASYGKDGEIGGEGEPGDIIFEIDPYDIDSYELDHEGRSFRQTTKITLTALEKSIHAFYSEHETPPASLEQLLAWEGKGEDAHALDGWGHLILYEVTDGVVTLTSFARDRKRGGVAKNKDIIVTLTLG